MRQLTQLIFAFVPAGQIIKDAPPDNVSRLTWQAVIGGVLYKGTHDLGAVNDVQPNDWASFVSRALLRVNALRAMTPEAAEKLKP